jgi:hypothetical protein
MPLVPLKLLWPALVTDAFAANITTALFMAGGAVVLRGLLADIGVGRLARLALVALFALHPMIVYYGANGLTEAPFVFTMLLTTRFLVRWLADGSLAALAGVGLSLALAYLTRYEAAVAAVGAIGLIGIVSLYRAWTRRRPDRPRPLLSALADVLIAAVPFGVAFCAWAFASWLIVGSLFPHFTSEYGNSSQVATLRPFVEEQTGQGTSAAIPYVAAQLMGLQPMFLAIVAVALGLSLLRRDVRVLGPLALMGPVLAFSVVGFLAGVTVGFLRYHVAIVPLAICLAGFCLARVDRAQLPNEAKGRIRALVASTPAQRLAHAAIAIAVLPLVALAIPSAYATIQHPLLAREEADQLKPALGGGSGSASFITTMHLQTRTIATDLDARNLGDGEVLVDVAVGNPIVLQSRHPRQFLITTDRDFKQAVADPVVFGVRYILVISPEGLGSIDAINRARPGFYETGEGLGRLVKTYGQGGMGSWRLYELDTE